MDGNLSIQSWMGAIVQQIVRALNGSLARHLAQYSGDQVSMNSQRSSPQQMPQQYALTDLEKETRRFRDFRERGSKRYGTLERQATAAQVRFQDAASNPASDPARVATMKSVADALNTRFAQFGKSFSADLAKMADEIKSRAQVFHQAGEPIGSGSSRQSLRSSTRNGGSKPGMLDEIFKTIATTRGNPLHTTIGLASKALADWQAKRAKAQLDAAEAQHVSQPTAQSARNLGRATRNYNRAQNAQQEATEAVRNPGASYVDRAMSRLNSLKQGPFVSIPAPANATAVETAAHESTERRRRQIWDQNQAKYERAARSPFAQIGLTKNAIEDAHHKFAGRSRIRDARHGQLTAAQQRLEATAKPGEVGHDSHKYGQLQKDVTTAKSRFHLSDVRASRALAQLGHASAGYAKATNVASIIRSAGAGIGIVRGVLSVPGAILTAAELGAKAPGMMQAAGEHQMESNRWQAGYSMPTAAAFSRHDQQTESLKFRQAEGMAGSTSEFQKELFKLRENVLPSQTAIKNVSNWIGTVAMKFPNAISDGGTNLGIAFEASQQGKLFDKNFWDDSRKELTEMKKVEEKKQSDTFTKFLGAASDQLQKKMEDRRINRPKPPVRRP